jgi:secreted PhoX family phosphatase
VPRQRGHLARGGQLQALAIAAQPSFDTRNWASDQHMQPGRWYDTGWVDLADVDAGGNDLRLRGFAAGAARFARGEGISYAAGDIVFTCTIGGRERLGQVFTFRPSPAGSRAPGRLRLLAESTHDSLLRHADNLTCSPWGDIIVCEDTADHCGLVGIQPGGRQYALADNAYTASELAGICFSPGGDVMFVNIQDEGLTLAVTGPWQLA